ncbi:uncharacterized protein TNCV_1364141 [Trichonephila clavipes]|uniref:Uncharacterized protein n=1 Tax=Trichonephila clavipes TaxID=2585209 RepID=A0A8X6V6E1_TRICX|nr:uncharacterized protein TNCV_1364141 [Trichonephila clavipes]
MQDLDDQQLTEKDIVRPEDISNAPSENPLAQQFFYPVAFLRLEINRILTMTMLLKMAFFLAVICILLPDEATTVADMLDNEAATTTVDPFRFLKLCSPGSERRNTCEKCTKVTRDPKTYKMCCENISGVGRWCRTFLDYTLPPRVVGIY